MKAESFRDCYEACEHFQFDKETTAEQCWNMGYQLGRKRWYWGPAWFVTLQGWINTQISRLRGRI